MQEESKYTELTPGEMLIQASGGDFEAAPAGEPLHFHVDKVSTVEGTNFNTKLPEKKLAIGFKLDAAGEKYDGQVYTQWFTPSLSERSNLAKMLKVMLGSVPVPFDPTGLVGRPVRATLKDQEKDGVTRQYLDQYLKPAATQKVVEKEVVLDEVPDADPLDDIDF